MVMLYSNANSVEEDEQNDKPIEPLLLDSVPYVEPKPFLTPPKGSAASMVS